MRSTIPNTGKLNSLNFLGCSYRILLKFKDFFLTKGLLSTSIFANSFVERYQKNVCMHIHIALQDILLNIYF